MIISPFYTPEAHYVIRRQFPARPIADRDRYNLRRIGSYFYGLSGLIASPGINALRICVSLNLQKIEAVHLTARAAKKPPTILGAEL